MDAVGRRQHHARVRAPSHIKLVCFLGSQLEFDTSLPLNTVSVDVRGGVHLATPHPRAPAQSIVSDSVFFGSFIIVAVTVIDSIVTCIGQARVRPMSQETKTPRSTPATPPLRRMALSVWRRIMNRSREPGS